MSEASPKFGWYFRATHDTSLKKWLVDANYPGLFIKSAKAHSGRIVPVPVDTAHDTLIIAEEEDGETCNGVDED